MEDEPEEHVIADSAAEIIDIDIGAAAVANNDTNTTNNKNDDSSSLTVEQARDRLETKLQQSTTSGSNNNAEDLKDALLFDSIQLVLKDHDHLKEKVGKLKSLLGRSAKAQRESKVEMDATQKRLDQALQEIQGMKRKMEKLSNRPSHMELLADFEANFDRALLSVGRQPEDTTPSIPVMEAAAVDTLLLQELAESKQRIEKLEQLNATLAQRSSQLELELTEQQSKCHEFQNQVTRLELEKRMAVMEADAASKEVQRKVTELHDMQLELDLVTKASVRANAMAAVGEEIRKKRKAERQQIQQLETKVQALQEWALASSEAKTLAQERVRVLEQQLRALHQQRSITTTMDHDTNLHQQQSPERQLFADQGSLVIGAGEKGSSSTVRLSDRIVLRWHFDLTSPDATLPFHLVRGACERLNSNADYIIRNRMVQGGAEGETENAFTQDKACAIVWDNSSSWIRPKTVKYTVEAIVVEDD